MHGSTFLGVEVHLPFLGPCVELVQVVLENGAVLFFCYCAVDDTVVSKQSCSRSVSQVVSYIVNVYDE